MWKHWLCTFVVFIYTLIQTNVGAHQRQKPQEVSSLKGCKRADKASLPQYVNNIVSEVNHVEKLKWQPELLIWVMKRIFSLQSSSLQLTLSRVQNDVETANDRRRSVGQVSWKTKKAKPQPNHTACATVRNWRNWTIIIIKYHHLSQLKAYGSFFFFFYPPSLFCCSCLLSSFFGTV